MEEVYRCVAPDGFRAELAAEGAWGAWLHEVPPVDASKGMIIAAELRGDLLAVRNFRRGPRDVANAIVTKRRMVLARDDDTRVVFPPSSRHRRAALPEARALAVTRRGSEPTRGADRR